MLGACLPTRPLTCYSHWCCSPVTFLFPSWVPVLSEVPLAALGHCLAALPHFSGLIYLKRGYFLLSESWSHEDFKGIFPYIADPHYVTVEKHLELTPVPCVDPATSWLWTFLGHLTLDLHFLVSKVKWVNIVVLWLYAWKLLTGALFFLKSEQQYYI